MNLASLCVICVQGWHGAAAPEIEKTLCVPKTLSGLMM
jgi:hypothetical protein